MLNYKDIIKVGQKVKFISCSGLPIITNRFLNEQIGFAKYFGIIDGKPEIGEIIAIDVKKEIVQEDDDGKDVETTMKHDCRVRWPNGLCNVFNTANLKIYDI